MATGSASLLLLIAFFGVMLAQGCVQAQDTIELLAIGSVGPAQSPIPDWLSSDPTFEISLVPTRLYDVLAIGPDEARRMLRLYFPRNEKAMETYECLLFSGGDVRYFMPSQMQMIVKAVESGTAAATDMGGMSKPLHPTWISSGLWVIFPNDVLSVRKLWDGGTPNDQVYRIIVNRELDRNPLYPFFALGIENLIGGRSRIIHPLPGSTVYAWLEAESLFGWNLGFRPASAVTWKYGKARTIALEGWFGHSWWSSIIDPSENEYGQDILINYLLDITGRPYIEDIGQVHLLRQSFGDFQESLSFIGNLLEFVERFGATTDSLNREIDEVRNNFRHSHELYLEGDVEGALRESQESIADLGLMREKAMKLRDRALRWIYMVEWLSITATLMLSGYVLDLLMLRKRLYRTTSTTRMRKVNH